MRVIFIFLLALVTTAQAQQINPVPDYIFRNQMSVGRNGVTDTAAYMSVGPRYGAVKGFMPPIVTDTNAVTGVKRNGLLIFSLQLNNFAYWDSTTARFRKITAEATVDSLIFATRRWRQKGDDSLGGIIAVKTDTGLISTKAYRQKGIDSVVTLISTLGGGTVLSVSAGTGMSFSTITTAGAVNADTLVLSTRARMQKGVDSLGAIVGTKVNISDTATMLAAYLRKADTTAMIAPYLRKVDTTAMLGNYVRAAGFGLVKSTYTLLSDTAAMATRARVQKGIDSVSALFTSPDTLTLSTRAWRQKGDDSLGVIIGTKSTATGTTNYLSKFTGTSALGNSIVYATTSEVGISTPSPTHTLDVNGRVRVRTIDSTATGMNLLYADADGVIKKTALSASTGGTVTSVATGYGLSGGTITTTGTLTADTLNLSTKAWRQKGIDSVATLTTLRVAGTGTSGYIPRWNSTNSIQNSLLYDNGTAVGYGLTSGFASRFHVKAEASDLFALENPTTTGSASYSSMRLLAYDGTSSSLGAYVALLSNSWSLTNFLGGAYPNSTVLQAQKSGGLSLVAAAGVVRFYSGGEAASNERMRITSAGDVAIGNTSPSYKLDVSGTLRNTTGAAFATSSGNVLIGTTTDGGSYKLDVQGALRNTTGANFATTSGNVGIGTTSPDAGTILHTSRGSNGTVATFGIQGLTINPRIRIDASETNNTVSFNTNYNGAVSPAITFLTTEIERMRITSAGNVGIGNTSPSEKLHVTGRIRATTIDSTATGMNMLYADATGVIKKAAVPSGGSGTVTSVATGFGLSGGTITTTGTLIVDSASVATRARVQKGVDSLATALGAYLPLTGGTLTGGLTGTTGAFNSSGSGNTFSVTHSSGSGIGVNIEKGGNGEGLYINKTSGSGNAATIIGTLNATTLVKSGGTSSQYLMADGSTSTLTNPVTGTGISGYFPKWTGTSSQDTSQLFQLGRNIGIGTASPTYRIHLPDAGNTANQAMIAGSVFGSDGNGQTITPSSGALAYYGQGGVGYLYGAQVSSAGRWGINTRSLNDATLSIDGNVKIVTIDSTSTARNMLYADANGVIKKAAGLSMADDVMTASGSWVVTKDAGSGFSINNVAYTTNGTTKMVTVDGAFYISAELFSDASWNDVATIPSGFRPQKTVNWTNNFIVSGAEYETTGGTDFTGALSWTYAQMRVTDEGKVQINGSINTNTLDAGGGDYVVIQFTQSYIIK